ncbi:unnamed protein product, partial [Closterium sp. NIES-53]
MAPGQQASAVDMAMEGEEDEEEEGLEVATSTEAAGVADTAMTTRTTDAVADGQEGRGAGVGRGRGRGGRGGRGGGAASMKSASNESESRDDRFPGQFFFVSTQASAGPEKDEGFEEPAAVGKVTLHSLDYWVIDSGATYSMTPRADLLTELECTPHPPAPFLIVGAIQCLDLGWWRLIPLLSCISTPLTHFLCSKTQ